MSKLLKPMRLDADPTHLMLQNNGNTGKELLIISLLNVEMQPRIDFAPFSIFFLQKCLSMLKNVQTYDAVIETLERLYVKTPNKIFARHELATRKQKTGESLSEFLEELEKLSKHCKFSAVTAEVYQSEMIGDSFINGISSIYIRQRLLENAESSLDRGYDIARTLILLRRILNYICNKAIK